MGSVSKNNRGCCGAAGVHESRLTPRQETPHCNVVLLEEVTSLSCWSPSRHRPHRALCNLHIRSQVCLIPRDTKIPPKAPATGALCCDGALCFNLFITTYLRKVALWQLGLDGWFSPSQHQWAALRGTWVLVEQNEMTRSVLSGGNKIRM